MENPGVFALLALLWPKPLRPFACALYMVLARIYPSCAENPAVQGGDVERGERSWPKLNSVSAAARCTGG